jgi:hypothetical protein
MFDFTHLTEQELKQIDDALNTLHFFGLDSHAMQQAVVTELSKRSLI